MIPGYGLVLGLRMCTEGAHDDDPVLEYTYTHVILEYLSVSSSASTDLTVLEHHIHLHLQPDRLRPWSAGAQWRVGVGYASRREYHVHVEEYRASCFTMTTPQSEIQFDMLQATPSDVVRDVRQQ